MSVFNELFERLLNFEEALEFSVDLGVIVANFGAIR